MVWSSARLRQVLRARLAGANPHVLLLAAVATVLAVDLVVSTFVPFAWYVFLTEPAWQAAADECIPPDPGAPACPPPIPRGMVWDGILTEYRIDLRMTLAGAYLFLVPVAWIVQGLHWFPWQPFVWLAAVGSGAAVLQVRRLSFWPRLGYALALAIVVSGFAAYHWSTAGD